MTKMTKTTKTCDTVAELIALGEPLGEHAEHAAACERCTAIVALPVELAATHRTIDPGLGFSARMTAGAQHRIGVRRRRRIAGGIALSAVAATFGVVVMTRHAAEVAPPPATADKVDKDAPPADPGEIAADTRMLLHLADTERSSHLAAGWGRISKPLRPYRAVLKGLTP
jgi:hypothetical protein